MKKAHRRDLLDAAQLVARLEDKLAEAQESYRKLVEKAREEGVEVPENGLLRNPFSRLRSKPQKFF